ncbi:hypothetical protein QUA71_07755 [Microcoleus sp. MON1_C5]
MPSPQESLAQARTGMVYFTLQNRRSSGATQVATGAQISQKPG